MLCMLSGQATFLSYYPIRESLNSKQQPTVMGRGGGLRRGMVFVQKPFSNTLQGDNKHFEMSHSNQKHNIGVRSRREEKHFESSCIVKGKVAFQIPTVRFRKRYNHSLYKLTGMISEPSEARFIETLLTQAHNCFKLYLFVILQHRVVVR